MGFSGERVTIREGALIRRNTVTRFQMSNGIGWGLVD